MLFAAVFLTPTPVCAAVSDKEDEIQSWKNSGDITERLKRDAEPKDYLFQFPGVSGVMKSWNDWKADLYKKHGFRFGISFTALYQKASDTLGTEDDAAGFDLDIAGTWTFLGHGTSTTTMLGFDAYRRDLLGTEISPQSLFMQYGSLYIGAAGFSEDDWVVSELWIHQNIKNMFNFRLGNIFPLAVYGFFPFKNFRTDFLDHNHVINTTMPATLQGFGGFVKYNPIPRLFFRLGLHDANADPHESGFDTYDGELFSIFEAGYSLVPREPGRPPAGHIQASLWHQDERVEAGIDDGWGITLSIAHRFGRFTPFLRYGYADVTAAGPTPARQMVNAGFALDRIFHQSKDRIGIAYTWAEPADQALNNQSAIDAFYRAQLTPQIQLGPTLQVIFNPVNNPDEDTVYVWGLRTRIYL